MDGLLTLAVVFLGLLSASAADVRYSRCEGAPFRPTSVRLDPNPVNIGTYARFQIDGWAAHDVHGGTIEAEVFYKATGVHNIPTDYENKDLCLRTSCPIREGRRTFTYNKYVPEQTPLGDYRIRIRAMDDVGHLEMCLEIDFKVTKPGFRDDIKRSWASTKRAWESQSSGRSTASKSSTTTQRYYTVVT